MSETKFNDSKIDACLERARELVLEAGDMPQSNATTMFLIAAVMSHQAKIDDSIPKDVRKLLIASDIFFGVAPLQHGVDMISRKITLDVLESKP